MIMSNLTKRKQFITLLLELEEYKILDLTRARLQSGVDPFEIIEDAQEAMRLVGERYEEGDYYISSMMMAGEIFREVIEIVEPLLVQQATGKTSGVILLATVQGDIHDIGKNIFQILLQSHGFTVIDLGVDVSPDQLNEKIQEIRPDIIALSGLLTIAYDSMIEIIQIVKNQDDENLSKTPIIIGGGTINEMVCGFVGADYWATDAMVGVQLCKQIIEEKNSA
jgi:5-methyltetrahydrofolate--homocysteine methyltransferase